MQYAHHEIRTSISKASERDASFPRSEKKQANEFLFSTGELDPNQRGSDRLRPGSLQTELSPIVMKFVIGFQPPVCVGSANSDGAADWCEGSGIERVKQRVGIGWGVA